MTETTTPLGKLKLSSEDFKNPRFNSGLDKRALRELADDIEANGLLYPLLVTADGVIVGGQRRFLALCILSGRGTVVDMNRIPVRVIRAGSDMNAIAVADALHRSELSSFEVATSFAAMRDAGSSRAYIAGRVNKSKSYVSRLLKLYDKTEGELRATWANGKISTERALELVDLPLAVQSANLEADAGKKTKAKRKHRKGGHGRPGVDATKALLDELRTVYGGVDAPQPERDEWGSDYAAGFRHALAYVVGDAAVE